MRTISGKVTWSERRRLLRKLVIADQSGSHPGGSCEDREKVGNEETQPMAWTHVVRGNRGTEDGI